MLPLSIAGMAPPRAAESTAGMDEERFRLFYERTARPLRGYLIRLLNDPALADDLLQESYLRLLKAKMPESVSEDHRKNYLFRIATNLMRDHKARRIEVALNDEATNAAAHDTSCECDVARLLAGLKPVQRELLWLAYVERFSHCEIARILSMKPQSIRPLLSRARHALAEALRLGGFGENVK
jgi:RNA polymerase sigma-70 factor (ECF subfamily)